LLIPAQESFCQKTLLYLIDLNRSVQQRFYKTQQHPLLLRELGRAQKRTPTDLQPQAFQLFGDSNYLTYRIFSVYSDTKNFFVSGIRKGFIFSQHILCAGKLLLSVSIPPQAEKNAQHLKVQGIALMPPA